MTVHTAHRPVAHPVGGYFLPACAATLLALGGSKSIVRKTPQGDMQIGRCTDALLQLWPERGPYILVRFGATTSFAFALASGIVHPECPLIRTISQDIVRVNPPTPSDSATDIVVSIQTANRKFHVKRDRFPFS